MEFSIKPELTEVIIVQWGIIILLAILAILLTKNLKKIPDKKQSTVEVIVDFINNIVEDTMGPNTRRFVPYIGTLGIFLLFMNLTGLIGIEPPTKDYSVALALAVITFLVIQVYAIKKNGLLKYFKGYTEPVGVLLPINVMERIMLPVSLSLRLFGNMMAATIIMGLIYKGLSKSLLGFPQLVIPVPLHFYFDVFDGAIQMTIFVMLTMINIKTVSEH